MTRAPDLPSWADPTRIDPCNSRHEADAEPPGRVGRLRALGQGLLLRVDRTTRTGMHDLRPICSASPASGKDHVAPPTDALAITKREHRLPRYFQSHGVHADVDLLAFGVSAISRVGDACDQNAKTIDGYDAALSRDP